MVKDGMLAELGPGIKGFMANVARVSLFSFQFYVLGLMLVALLVMPLEVPLFFENLETVFACQRSDLGLRNGAVFQRLNLLVDCFFYDWGLYFAGD